MEAELLLRKREALSEGICVLRYDNEAGKGDHKHVDEREVPCRFIDLATLQADFWQDMARWRARRCEP